MPTRRARLRRRIYNRIPAWFKNNDFEIFASMLCFFAGLPLVLGKINPASMEALLPIWVVFSWGFILSFSPLLIVLGLVKRSSRPVSESIFWIRVEAIGLTALAYSSYIYAVAIISAGVGAGWPAAMLITAFGLTCHTRELGLQVKIADFLLGLGVNEKR
jgi:hypothetical protein